jgi:hypothetical protein
MSKKTKTKRWEYLGGKVDSEIVQAVKTVAIVSPVPLNVQERMEFFLRKGLVAHKNLPTNPEAESFSETAATPKQHR